MGPAAGDILDVSHTCPRRAHGKGLVLGTHPRPWRAEMQGTAGAPTPTPHAAPTLSRC